MGKSLHSPPTCPDFVGDVKIIRELGRGATSVVYEGERGGVGYAIKILTVSTFEKEIKQRFYREAGILARIHHPNLVKTHKVSRPDEEPPYIVMDLVRGQSLATVLKRGPLNEQKTLSIASEIVSALNVVHRNGLIHRDLKPQNIMLEESGAVKLIDFGLAEDNFLKERQLAIVGTLLYTAPEQSGVLSREVDSRSDLYSLGIILFECLMGRPPFQATDAAELINLHLSSPIPNVREEKNEISENTANLIARLMAKDPDDRYKSTDELSLALNKLLDNNTRIETKTNSANLEKSGDLTLAGRKAEFAQLNAALQKSLSGRGQTFVVDGEAGSGKSRLVRELIREAQRGADPIVLHAKANLNQALPFGPLREAIDRYLNAVAKLPENRRDSVFKKIAEKLAERGALLKNFSPHLKSIFSTLPDNSIQNARSELFFDALTDLVISLASASQPLVFFIDDLQWIDDSSRQVLKRISSRIENQPIMIIATARSTGAEHDSAQLYTTLSKSNFNRLALEPLDIFSTRQMILDYLGCAEVDDETVRNIFNRSNGNPFAVQQFLIALVYNGLLIPNWGKWELNTSGLESVELPTDIVQLLLKRSEILSADAKQILKYAAVLSDHFEVATLVYLSGFALTAVTSAIASAIAMNLLEPDGSGYRFIHDRVMEAFESLWSERERALVHGKMANYLFERFDGDHHALFKMAKHYGQSLTVENASRIYSVCCQAARAAYENHAIDEALSYLSSAQKVIEQNQSLRTGEFEELFGNCTLRAKMFKESEVHFTQALQLTTDKTARARVLGKLSWLSSVKGEKESAWSYVNRAFIELGVRPLKKDLPVVLSALFNWARAVFIDKFVGVLNPPTDTRVADRLRTLVEISSNAVQLGFFDLKGDLMALSGLRSSIWARRLGISKELVFSYSDFAGLAGMFRLKRAASWYGSKAIEYAKVLRDPSALANAQVYSAHSVYLQAEDDLLIETLYRQVLPFAFIWAEPSFTLAAIGGITMRLLRRGQVNEAEKILNLGYESDEFKIEMLIKLVAVYAMQGQISRAQETMQKVDTYLENEERYAIRSKYAYSLAMYALEQNDLGEFADRIIKDFYDAGYAQPNKPDFARFFLTPSAHIRLRQWLQAEGAARAGRFDQLTSALEDLKKNGSGGLYRREPDPLTRCHIFFIEAVISGEQGHLATAHEFLDEADKFAIKTDCPWILFESYRYRARLFLRSGSMAFSERYVKFALQIAVDQGYSLRREKLLDEFNLQNTGTVAINQFAPTLTQRAGFDEPGNLFMQRQLDAILKYSIASSKVFNLEDHCSVALQEIIRLLNPERAVLFLFEKKSDKIQMQIGQDSSGHSISDLSNYSKSIIEKVRTSLSPVLVTGSDRDGELTSESIIAYDLRSIAAAPLVAMGELIGVIYLDSRVAKGIFKEIDVRLLLAFGSHIAVAIDSARATQLELEKSKLEKDLEVVGAVQSLLLPKISKTTVGQLEACGYYQTATQSGGDWWWIDQTTDGKLRVILGDVTGHGAGAAMVTALVASCYDNIKQMAKDASIDMILQHLNQTLMKFTNKEYWMTFSVVEFDQAAELIHWWTAGAPPAFVSTAAGCEEFYSKSATMPLGSGDLVVAKTVRSFRPGDQLMLFSDGLYEFRTAANKTFGLRPLMRIYSESVRFDSPERQIEHITTEVAKRRWAEQLEDDVTLAIVKYRKI